MNQTAFIVSLFLLALLVGCSQSQSVEVLSELKGSDVSQLTAQWGEPDLLENQEEGQKKLTWRFSNRPRQRNGIMNDPFDYPCLVLVQVDQQDRIQHSSMRGDGCHQEFSVNLNQLAGRVGASTPVVPVDQGAARQVSQNSDKVSPTPQANKIQPPQSSTIRSVTLEINDALLQRLDREAGRRNLGRQQLLNELLDQHLPSLPK